MKLQERRKEAGIEQADLAQRVGTNAPMMSAFENHKCIPTPSMMKAICKELNCEVLDIYNAEEIFITTQKRKGPNDNKTCYRLTVALPNKARTVFNAKQLKKCGFRNLKDFMWCCYKWLEEVLK